MSFTIVEMMTMLSGMLAMERRKSDTIRIGWDIQQGG